MPHRAYTVCSIASAHAIPDVIHPTTNREHGRCFLADRFPPSAAPGPGLLAFSSWLRTGACRRGRLGDGSLAGRVVGVVADGHFLTFFAPTFFGSQTSFFFLTTAPQSAHS